MGLFFHKLGNTATCYSQFWKMKGTRNPHLWRDYALEKDLIKSRFAILMTIGWERIQ